ALEGAARDDPALPPLAGRLTDLSYQVADVAAELASYLAGLEVDPVRLAEVEDRRAELLRLTRKYAGDIDGVLAWADEAGRRLATVDISEEARAGLAEERDAAAAALAELATALHDARVGAANRFGAAVTAELAGLAMPRARVAAAVRLRTVTSGRPSLPVHGQPAAVGPDGADEVELLLQAHPDAPALPLAKGASGGPRAPGRP